jgi:AraC-like DNA-binding protein
MDSLALRLRAGDACVVRPGEVHQLQPTRALLRDTDLAVAEVARNVGYDDPYYFSRVFKAREGCAPLYYRRRSRADWRPR